MVRTVNLLRCWLQTQTSCIVQISVCVSTCLIRSHLWDWTDMLRLHTIDTFNDVNVCTNPGQLVKIIFCWSVSCIVGCAYLFLLCSQVHCHAPPSWLELDPFRIRICDDDEIETVYLFKRFIAEFRVCGDGWFNPYTLIASVEVVKVTRILIWSMKSIDLIAHKSSYMNWIPCHTQRITGYSNLNFFQPIYLCLLPSSCRAITKKPTWADWNWLWMRMVFHLTVNPSRWSRLSWPWPRPPINGGNLESFKEVINETGHTLTRQAGVLIFS